ncbi:TetR/AcrR family transcriptional regulator [Actinoplanes sp. NPDC051346]|uniref:TetR/AcrR family transcriptional regulator n=1 Tax=Actinoplanes sp. NPDC051346 TaxID=3155048 RepID=UPI003418637E
MSDARTEQTRRRIVQAACDAIAEVGFEGVRMRLIAERAGVSTALLHYHFDNREKLFLAAMAYSFEHAGAEDYQAAPPTEQPNTWMLARIIDACLPRTPELRRDFLLWQELWLRAARDVDSRLLAVDLYRQMRDWAAGVIQAGIANGEFTDCTVSRVADLLLVLTDGYGIRLLLDDPQLTLDDARAAVWLALSADLGLTGAFPASKVSLRR